MLRTVNASCRPATGAPLRLAVTTGDAIDNAQWNELQTFLTLLDGGLVRPDSGGPRHRGRPVALLAGRLVLEAGRRRRGRARFLPARVWLPAPPGPAGARPAGVPRRRPGRAVAGLPRQPRGAQPGRRDGDGGHRRRARGRAEAGGPAGSLRPRPGAGAVRRPPRGLHGRPVPGRHGRPRAPPDHQAGLCPGALPARCAPGRARVRRAEPAGRHRLLRPRHPGGPADRAGHRLPGRGRRGLPRPPAGPLAAGAAGRGPFGLPRARPGR